ncbi:MAG TPA: beta-propeller fold lactonase family protein [Vicinamibacterales bacterium]|nr:beta-propeller fold lactonase family protein [Vicinamibacterales bacterium]
MKTKLFGAVMAVCSLGFLQGAGTVRIIQTNAAGDSVMLIDPVTNKVVGEIKDIEVNHGAQPAPDGSRLYITDEAESTLDVADLKTLKVIKRIPLTNHPNNLAVSKDGKRVYAAIVAGAGAVDVIDTTTLTRVKSIRTEGGNHNVYVTPDGKFVVAGSIPGRKISVIDQKTEEVLWTLPVRDGVRPIMFDTNPDGSTKHMFAQLSNFNGFIVVDFATHQIVNEVKLPEVSAAERVTEGLQGAPAHGLAVTPDQKTLCVLSKMNTRIYFYSLPDLKLQGESKVGHHPDWVTLTPDGKRAYVANAGSNSVSVIDIASRKEIATIPVGQVPKRNATAILP